MRRRSSSVRSGPVPVRRRSSSVRSRRRVSASQMEVGATRDRWPVRNRTPTRCDLETGRCKPDFSQCGPDGRSVQTRSRSVRPRQRLGAISSECRCDCDGPSVRGRHRPVVGAHGVPTGAIAGIRGELGLGGSGWVAAMMRQRAAQCSLDPPLLEAPRGSGDCLGRQRTVTTIRSRMSAGIGARTSTPVLSGFGLRGHRDSSCYARHTTSDTLRRTARRLLRTDERSASHRLRSTSHRRSKRPSHRPVERLAPTTQVRSHQRRKRACTDDRRPSHPPS